MRERIFTFNTTHHALWAEDVAVNRGIPAEVIPAPAESKAKCSLALRTFPDRFADLERALEEEGVAFALYPSRTA
ncbi:MAG: hypothetical protein BMS9Abin29_1694 [Gemmatimonadota bacterium]|nr:MAG: hypothetical protein BMS9Abin29_1694 [Gemmatimonadota bacterium]